MKLRHQVFRKSLSGCVPFLRGWNCLGKGGFPWPSVFFLILSRLWHLLLYSISSSLFVRSRLKKVCFAVGSEEARRRTGDPMRSSTISGPETHHQSLSVPTNSFCRDDGWLDIYVISTNVQKLGRVKNAWNWFHTSDDHVGCFQIFFFPLLFQRPEGSGNCLSSSVGFLPHSGYPSRRFYFRVYQSWFEQPH